MYILSVVCADKGTWKLSLKDDWTNVQNQIECGAITMQAISSQIFTKDTHAIARPLVGLLWVHYLINILAQFLQLFMQYFTKLDRIITALNSTWCRHQMETFSALLAICAGNSPVTSEFPAQRPVTWSFDVFFDLHLNKWLSKQSWGW